ncbi:sigma-70 family RNA polymerase sigma factor [Flavitalea sp. BT771]|uniref:RNA polymerase sigma factor n=1 Tax=Flavitalea sp. BT771 TaxID=3063329 RepID=UPI0026E2181E|nr:sigma-70 family RNA polymerase sigma factor [Flavitalea sp. BT771]MDO6429384.1 sigma-70 family RNA polymerase sigma factor [Flavitalea sp. BT771]MDV6218488.1 sigma-70 family RNA polymerase sigma factor [Flavitalea sp. BT771]
MAKAAYTQLTDEQALLQRTAEGSREAFEKLYAHYYAGLYRFISFIIDSHEDTEEIIQDIFLKIWLKKETLIGIRSFDDYLFRMARNRVFDMTRQSRSRLNLSRQLGQSMQAATDSTYNAVIFREYHEIAQEAINLLPPRKKEIFLMNARDEMTAQEIADQLGATRGAIKKQLFEAIHFIKGHLREKAGWPFFLFF